MKLPVIISILFFSYCKSTAQITWANNVACIVYENCVSCHNPNGIGPFSLTNYEQVVSFSNLIASKVEKREMPPWPPDPDYASLGNERILTNEEIQTIINWVELGSPSGDLSQAPEVPVYETIERINDPDLVVQLPEYTSKAVSNDEYRCFVFPEVTLTERSITEFEIIPGNDEIVHHVLVFQDLSATPKLLDDNDPDPGYLCFGGIGSGSAELLGGWVPGQQNTIYPEGMGIKLPAKTNIVVQLHYPQGSQGKKDDTKINLKLSDSEDLREIRITAFLNHDQTITEPLFIPANTVKSFREQFFVPLRATMIGIAPHMHLIGKSIRSYIVAPGSDTIPLIDIPQWDFEWQGFYQFNKPVIVEPGSWVIADAVYDNTINNLHNPNFPPKDVSLGEATTDEMMLVYFTWLFYKEGDAELQIVNSLNDETIPCEEMTTTTNEIITTDPGFVVSPNPFNSSDVLKINFKNPQGISSYHLQLYHITGQKMAWQYSTKGTAEESFSFPADLPDGVYLLVLKDSNGQIKHSQKIVKAQ